MKIKFILLVAILFISNYCFSQYIGVKAKYTETRLVDDSPNPPKRENRLILSFYEVNMAGIYTPVSLSNFDLYVYKEGLQYGSAYGGVADSAGNNYEKYAWTAPKVVSYHNSYNPAYIDCDPNLATKYTVNGYELDCGFITVSHWDLDYGTGLPLEIFTAPNVCLPYYEWPDPYYILPGNVNFGWPVPPSAPYNLYNFTCAGSPQQFIIRGVLPGDTGHVAVALPVRFANVNGNIEWTNRVSIAWSNMTESEILHYAIEKSVDGNDFLESGIVLPVSNNDSRADYTFNTIQNQKKSYYRIKAVENNGSVFYSTIISLTLPESVSNAIDATTFLVYPNPVTTGMFHLKLTGTTAGRYVLTIINSRGEKVKVKLIDHTGGDLTRAIDVANLAPGMYQVLVWSAFSKYTQKIVVR